MLSARVNLSHGLVQRAAWVDNDHFLTLVVSPGGAAVWRTSFTTLSREKFLSSQFIEEYLCGAELAPRLSWTLSPAKRYLFFSWFLDDGSRKWALLDISDPPRFKLKKFAPPPGMQIERVLFSPDDRYAAFIHDSFREGSEVSVLILDLEQGTEHWRIDSHKLSFVNHLWWSGAIFDSPRFFATASLFDGQFLERPGVAHFDLTTKQIEFPPVRAGLLFGAETIWGKTEVYQNDSSLEHPYYLLATIPGYTTDAQIPLSSKPLSISALPEPGLVLLKNTSTGVTDALWLVDIISGDKHLVDSDCAEFSLTANGQLLVQAKMSNELRIYELYRPGQEERFAFP